MYAYIDSSVLLRVVLAQPNRIPFPETAQGLIASKLLEIECMRVLDRHRILERWDEATSATYFQALHRALSVIELVRLGSAVVQRACSPFPTILGTLDALHLSTLLVWRTQMDNPTVLLTHDHQLATAARSLGVEVRGSPS